MGPDDGTSELSFTPSSTTRQRVRFGAVPPQFLPMLLALSTGPAHADAVTEGNRSNGRALSASSHCMKVSYPRCGAAFGACDGGTCCSEHNWCGRESAYCGAGNQAVYSS